jgi:hypothetical protein
MKIIQVKRQSEPKLIKAVAELCWGNPTPDTHAFMRSLDRPIKPQEEQPTVLFGVNFDVDYYNQNQLDNMEGQSKVYRALDQGIFEFMINLKGNCTSCVLSRDEIFYSR